MKQLFIFLTLVGILPGQIIAQDSKGSGKSLYYNNGKQLQGGTSGFYKETIIDTVIVSPDGSIQYFSYSLSANENEPGPSFFSIWNLPGTDVIKEFEQAQKQILRQINEDRESVTKLMDEQVKLRNHQVKQQMRKKKEALFTDIMQLTPEEAKRFWPLYNEFEQRKELIQTKRQVINQKLRAATVNSVNEREADAICKQHVDFLVQETNLQQEYYRRLKTILPSSKLLMMYKAEDAFKLLMLQSRGQMIIE